MKVAIGVCGIGLGHSSRELQVARHLRLLGHEVRILTFGQAHEFFMQTELSTFCREIYVPWVHCDAQGLNIPQTFSRNRGNFIRGMQRNVRTLLGLALEGFRADVCVSDYEPVTGWFALLCGAPLVTVDHQHTYLVFHLEPLENGLSPREEQTRLRIFFPRVERRVVLSFFRVDAPPNTLYQFRLLPALVRPEIGRLTLRGSETIKGRVLIYLSRYDAINSYVAADHLLPILGACSGWTFKVYANDPDLLGDRRDVPQNVEVARTLSGRFDEDLASAEALISTAGFTLLSEAVALGIPILAVPLATYDQNLCASIVEQSGIGMRAQGTSGLSTRLVQTFLQGLPKFRLAMQNNEQILSGTTSDVLSEICDEILASFPREARSKGVSGKLISSIIKLGGA